jgi:antitoxin ParD1/3/4
MLNFRKEISFMTTKTMNISLPDTMKTFIEERIETDGYGTVSEYVRDLIRDDQKRREEAKLERLLLEGLESGKATPLTKADFEAIKKRGIERLKHKANK